MIYKLVDNYESGAEFTVGRIALPEGESAFIGVREYHYQFETVGDLGAGCWLRRAPLLPPWKMLNAVELRGRGYNRLIEVYPLLVVLRPLNDVLVQSEPAYAQMQVVTVDDCTQKPSAGIEYSCLHIRRYLSFAHTVAGPQPTGIPSMGLKEKRDLTTLANDRPLYDVVSKVPFWRLQSSINCWFFNEEMVQKLVAVDKRVKPLFKKIECLAD